MLEYKRTEAFLRNGVVAEPAVVTGDKSLAALTLPGDVAGNTAVLRIDGVLQNIDLTGFVGGTPSLLIAAIQALGTGAVVSLSGNFIRVTSNTTGEESSVEWVSGNLLVDLFTAGTGGAPYSDVGESIAVVDDGNGDVVSPIVEFLGEDFTATQRCDWVQE